ncbi:MAG: threonine/homoserine/homoserine lactone efflux protein [Octadecabacter sp.]|jgi:threonine/homoserine/homoserine lactone efflux protein
MDLSLWMIFVTVMVALIIISGTIELLTLTKASPQLRKVAPEVCLTLRDFVAMTAYFAELTALVIALATLSIAQKWVGMVNFFWMGIGVIRSVGSVMVIWIEGVSRSSVRKVFCMVSILTLLKPKGYYVFHFFIPELICAAAALMPHFEILVAIHARIYVLLAERLRVTICKLASLSWMTRIGGNVLITMGVLTATLRKAA